MTRRRGRRCCRLIALWAGAGRGVAMLAGSPAAGTIAAATALAMVPGVPGSPVIAAQEAPAALPTELSFERAVEVARERNPSYRQQLNQVATSEYQARQSFGQAFLPSLSGSVGFGARNSLRQSWEEDSGEIQSGSVESTSSSASQSLSTRLSLFNWQQVQTYRAARSQTRAAESAAAYQAARLRTTVGQAYFDVVQRGRLVAVERGTLEAARAQLAAVEELLRVAAKQPTDVLGAELAVLQAEQSLQEAEGEVRKAGLQLREQMGVAMDAPFELTSGFPAIFDPATLDAGQLIRRALGASPLIAEREARVTAADRSVAAARAARYPSISVSGSWYRGLTAQQWDAFGSFDLPNRTYSADIGVSVPLFNQMSTSAAVGRASVERDNAREGLREARLQLEREVRAAVIDLENAYTAVRVAERSVEVAGERLEQGRELYRLGSIEYTSLQQMIDQLAARERALVTARYRFATALLQLEEKVGDAVTPAP